MSYDKPAQVVWVANLTAAGYVNSNFIKVVGAELSNNIVNTFSDLGYLSSNPTDYFVNTNLLYSITDNSGISNLSSFNWTFSSYAGYPQSDTAVLAVNYFNNNTANNMSLVINYNNQTISPPFYFDPYASSPSPTASKTFVIPAGAQNYPIPLWAKVNEYSATTTFTCLLCTNPSIIIADNVAKYTNVYVTPTPTPTPTATPTPTPSSVPQYGYLEFRANGTYREGNFLGKNSNYLNVDGTQDYTIEFFINPDQFVLSGPVNTLLISFGTGPTFPDNGSFFLSYNAPTNDFVIGSYSAGVGLLYVSLSADVWQHVALCRKNSDVRVFVDGVPSTASSNNFDFSTMSYTSIGGVDAVNALGTYAACLSGSMSNIRITSGVALYDGNFTPPTLPLTAGPNTTLLMLATSEPTKYLNSIDSQSFSSFDAIAGESVKWVSGPI